MLKKWGGGGAIGMAGGAWNFDETGDLAFPSQIFTDFVVRLLTAFAPNIVAKIIVIVPRAYIIRYVSTMKLTFSLSILSGVNHHINYFQKFKATETNQIYSSDEDWFVSECFFAFFLSILSSANILTKDTTISEIKNISLW